MKTAKKIWMGIGLMAAVFTAGLLLLLSGHRALAASNVYVTSQKQIEDGIATLHFVNRFEIVGTFNGHNVQFIDKGPSDNTFNYKPTDGFCATGDSVNGINIDGSQMAFENLGNYIDIPASIDLDYASAPTVGAKCNDTSPNKISTLNGSQVTIASPDNASVMFNWNSDGTISRADGASGWAFTAIATGSTIYRSDANKCAKVLVLRSGNQSGTVYDLTQTPTGRPDASKFSDLSDIFDGGTCYVKSVNLYDQDSGKFQTLSQDSFTISGQPPDNAGTCTSDCTPNDNGNGGGSVQKGQACNAGTDCKNGICEVTNGDCGNDSCAVLSANPFSWALCPILDVAQDLSNGLLSLFESQLSFTVSDLNGNTVGNLSGSTNCQPQADKNTCSSCQKQSPNDPNACQEKVKRLWSIIRDLASAMVVIVMLVMVISQAVSWGPFDAYSVRKMLPRLVVAVILIQVSWDLLAWLINLVDGIGKGLADLMYYPFGGSANLDLGSLLANANIGNTTQSGVAWGLLTILGVLTAGVLAVAALPTVIFFAIGAIFSLLVGLVTLMFRKILLIMCLVFSPLALLAWVLPGTQNYYKLWKDNFTKALLMFPLAVAIVASGRIFAYITGTQDTGKFSVLLNFIFIMVGYFAPLFILPKTFKWGGSIMSSVGGTIKSISKPVSEKTGNVAKEELQRRQGQLAKGYNPEAGWRSRTFRRVASGHAIPFSKRSQRLAIATGDKWSQENDEQALALIKRKGEMAMKNGYETIERDDEGRMLDAHGNVTTDENLAARKNLTGVAAMKQMWVDLAEDGKDKFERKMAIRQLTATASWPEVQGSFTRSGKRVIDTPDWAPSITTSPEDYPRTLRSRVDSAPHIKNSADDATAKLKASGHIFADDVEERNFKSAYRIDYSIDKQMSNEDFATQSDGYWEEAARLANYSGTDAEILAKAADIRAHLIQKFTAIQQAGPTARQQMLGHLANGGELEKNVNKVLGAGAVVGAGAGGAVAPTTVQDFLH